MADPSGPRSPWFLGDRGRGVQWALLLVLSIVFVVPLELLHLPAALLLGPMIAAIIAAAAGQASVRVRATPFILAQGVIGVMIARSLSASILGEVIKEWPLVLGVAVAVMLAANVMGILLARRNILPGTTAIWGFSPGAAMAQIMMAEAYGGDMRLVAFMQYLRIVFVAGFASIVARIWVAPLASATGPSWFPPSALLPFVATIIVASASALIAQRLRIPAGPLLLPLLAGAVLQAMGILTIELPPWLLAASYGLVGWTIGLQFTRSILAHAARALPRILFSIIMLIAICGVFAAALTYGAGIDPLTAYLATSPGSADAIAIIAVSSKVDLPFVMALQTARFLLVAFTGPMLSKFIVKRIGIPSAVADET